jgi:biotin carboxylase
MLKKILLVDAPNDTNHLLSACAAAALEPVLMPGAAPDAEAITAAAREAGVHGIWSCSESSWEPVLAAATRLGLPRLDTAFRSDLMVIVQRGLTEAGISHAHCQPEDDAVGAKHVAETLGAPVWVRPLGGLGVPPCTRVEHLADLSLAVEKGLKRSPEKRVLLQRAVEGDVFRVLGFKVHRAFYPIEVIREETSCGAYRYATRSVIPAGLGGAQYTAVTEVARHAGLAIPPCHGLVEIEVVVSSQGAVFTGVWATPQIDPLRAALLEKALGINLHAEALRVAAGELPRVSAQKELGVAIAWLSAHSGVVTEVGGVDAARELPGICEVTVNITPGETLGHVVDTTTRDRIGHVIACCATAKEALATLDRATTLIQINTRPMVA